MAIKAIIFDLGGVVIEFDFYLYSAAIATNLDYPVIDSGSSVILIINIFQSVLSIVLVALVISTFVQKSSAKPVIQDEPEEKDK